MEKNFRPHPNSFKNTFCVFHEVNIKDIEGLAIQYDSKAGSKYYYTKLGMYRFSNHWGRLANSKWRLQAGQPESESKYKLGYALWEHFYPDNAQQELYYLEVDFVKCTINYQHKYNPDYDCKAILRTSFETTKRIKQIRNLFNLTSWAQYFVNYNIDFLRENIITDMIYTTKTLEEIKRNYL